MQAIKRRSSQQSPNRGRPREFDISEALDKATTVFRERGYHGTSITDLKGAMALASGSIYKAFKDKRAIFLAVLDRYTAARNERLTHRLETATSGRDRLRTLLDFYIESAHGVEGRRGCLIVGSAIEMVTFDTEMTARVTTAFRKNEALIVDLIAQGQADGSIPPSIDRQTTARLMLCILQGLRVVGKTGRTRDEMAAVVDTAMKLLG